MCTDLILIYFVLITTEWFIQITFTVIKFEQVHYLKLIQVCTLKFRLKRNNYLKTYRPQLHNQTYKNEKYICSPQFADCEMFAFSFRLKSFGSLETCSDFCFMENWRWLFCCSQLGHQGQVEEMRSRFRGKIKVLKFLKDYFWANMIILLVFIYCEESIDWGQQRIKGKCKKSS